VLSDLTVTLKDTITAVVILVALALCGTSARAQLVDDLGSREKLAEAGYRYDDTASLVRALEDKNELVAVIATTFLANQPATPEIIGALRAASDGPRELVAKAAFVSLQAVGATGWEGSALGLMQSTRNNSVRLQLAGTLAKADRSEGWYIVRDALTPDDRSMGVALWQAAPFQGLKAADGTTIDAISELRRLQRELRQRGRSSDASLVEVQLFEANKWNGRRRGGAR